MPSPNSTLIRTTTLVLALVLTACGPVVYVTPPPLGPAEIQRLGDGATNTAIAAAATGTADARAAQAVTAQVASGRETSTASAQGTLGALAAQQTQTVLQMTQLASIAQATDSAARATAGAVETSGARGTAAAATEQAGTPTAVALRTQEAGAATQAAIRQERGESVAGFWLVIRWTIAALIIGLSLVFCTIVLVRGVSYIRAEDRAAAARVARDALQLLGDGYVAQWRAGQGYEIKSLPPPSDAAVVIDSLAPVPTPSKIHAWRQSTRLLGWYGHLHGFTRAGLVGRGIVTDPAYRRLVTVMKQAGVLGDVIIPGKRGRETGFTPEWNFSRLTAALSAGELDTALPSGEDAPAVGWTVPQPDTPTKPDKPDTPTPYHAKAQEGVSGADIA